MEEKLITTEKFTNLSENFIQKIGPYEKNIFIENLGLYLWKYDIDSKVFWFSEGFYKWLSIETNNQLYKLEDFLQFVPPKDQKKLLKSLKNKKNFNLHQIGFQHPNKNFYYLCINGEINQEKGLKKDYFSGTMHYYLHKVEKSDQITQMLKAINEIHSTYLDDVNIEKCFNKLLEQILFFTKSEIGFIDEAKIGPDGKIYFTQVAVHLGALKKDFEEFYKKYKKEEYKFQDLNTLWGAVASSGKIVISNDPKHDPRAKGLPKGHPPLRNFMGIPMFYHGKLVGIVGVANKKGNYTINDGLWLEPFISTCASFIHAKQAREEARAFQEKLREKDEKIRTIFNSSFEIMFVLDLNGKILELNEVASDFIGKKAEEVIGKSFGDLNSFNCYPENIRLLKKAIQQVKRGNIVTDKLFYISKNGKLRIVNFSLKPIYDKNNVLNILAEGRDLTELFVAERSLKESESLFKSLFENAGVGILLIEDNDIVLANQFAAKILQFTHSDDIISLKFDKIFPHFHLNHRETFLVKNCEIIGKKSDGTEFIANATFTPILRGEKKQILCVFQDITEEKRIQNILKLMNSKFKAESSQILLETLVCFISETLNADYVFISIPDEYNEETQKTLAVSKKGELCKNFRFHIEQSAYKEILNEEFVIYKGKKLYSLFPDFNQYFDEQLESLIAVNLPLSNSDSFGILVCLFSSPIKYTEHINTLLQVFASRAKLELERRKYEMELLNLRVAIENLIREAIILTDKDGIIKYVNPAFELLTGYTKKEFIGKKILEIDKNYEDFLFQILERKKAWHGILNMQRKDGKIFKNDISATPIFDDNEKEKIKGFIFVFQDITKETELRERLEEQKKFASIGKLAGAIAHEIKNPIFAISGGIQILLNELNLQEPYKEITESIFNETLRIDRLIKELLSVYRNSEFQYKTIDLITLIRRLISITTAILKQKKLKLQFKSPTHSVYIKGDEDKLLQVFLNILNNAIEASPLGSKIELSIEEEKEEVIISVRDYGKGIEPNILPHIFDPLFTTKRNHSGIGLFISQNIILQHRGKITAENIPDGGACFKVLLPIER